MKKLNNKGFAVSTILYSLILMVMLIVIMIMSTMASSRNNNRELIEAVEEELNGIDNSTMILTNSDQSLPFNGLYRIELSTGKDFYYWYVNLQRNCTAALNGSIVNIGGTCSGNYGAGTPNGTKISNVYNIALGTSTASVEFIGEGVTANNLGRISAEEVASGNYYIAIELSGKTYVMTNNGTDVGVNNTDFNPNNVWSISTMADAYKEDGNVNNTTTETGNRVVDLNTTKSLEIASGQIPISGSKLRADHYFSFDGPKKWNFEHLSGYEYYICNVAMDARDTGGPKCRRVATTKIIFDNNEELEVGIDPVVLSFVPTDPNHPDSGGTIEFRKICTCESGSPGCTEADECEEGIRPEYQKFTLYRKS